MKPSNCVHRGFLSASLSVFGQKLSGVTHDICSRGEFDSDNLEKVKEKICTNHSGIRPLGCDEKVSHFPCYIIYFLH